MIAEVITMTAFSHLALLFVGYVTLVSSDSDSGPVGPIIFHDMMPCENDINTISFKAELVTGADQRQKIVISFETPMDIDATALVTIHGDKFSNGDWETDFYTVDEKPFLKFLGDFVPGPWNEFRREIEPQIPTPDVIPAGSYKLEGLYADSSALSAPTVFYGRYMGRVTVIVEDEEIACVAGEMEFKPNGAV